MSRKYTIDIDDRAVWVVVKQYDVYGDEVVISNISPPGAIVFEYKERSFDYQKLIKKLKLKRKEVAMANLTEEIRSRCEEVLKVPVVKVKRTDDPNVGLALIGGGSGYWIDLTTWKKTKAVTIKGEKVKLIKKPAKAKAPKAKTTSKKK